MAGACMFRLFRLALGIVALALPIAGRADLPPPPRGTETLPSSMNLRLELVVNGAPTGHIVPVVASGGDFLVDAQDLRSARLHIDPVALGAINVSLLPGVGTVYDAGGQRLLLTVASDSLPHQQLGSAGMRERIPARSSFGALVNYDLYVSRSDRRSGHASLYSEARIFGAFGVLRTTISYSEPLGDGGRGRFTRYDTSLTHIDEERVLTYEAGDLITRTLPWAGAARVGGIQISRDFAVRPDIVTYPLPSFSGIASVPTAVDLFINGHRTSSGILEPGPFTIGDVPYVTGAGEAVIATRDAQGRRISTTIPFYVSSSLLRPGLSDFALSAGFIRKYYGIKDISYGSMAASGSARYGLTDGFTMEAQGQVAPSLVLAGLGGVLRIGRIGVADAAVVISRHLGKSSTQTRLGYQYNDRRFNLAVSHTRRSRAFTDLGNYELSLFRLPHRETQATGSLVLGPGSGTIGLSWIDSRREKERFRLLNFSYSRPLARNVSLLLTAGREMDTGRTSAMLQLLASLRRRGTAVGGVERTTGGGTRGRIGYSRSVPTEGGLGWRADIAEGRDDGTRYQADITWRLRAFQLQAGAYGGGARHTQWGDVSGSVVLMDGDAFAANRISDAFVLVSTDGMEGIMVRQENQPVGTTDRNGHLLLPWVNAYYGAKFAIDPLGLPANVGTPVVEQRAAVKLGSGRVVHFPVRRLHAATVVLHDPDGAPLPPGTPVRLNGEVATYVGWDGIVYFENISKLNRLDAFLRDGSACSFTFPFDGHQAAIPRIGPLSCQ